MNRKHMVLGSALIAALFAASLAAPAFAKEGTNTTPAATPAANQAKIEAVQKKYDTDLTRMEAQLRTITRDLDRALAEQDTAKTATLRQKLADQQKEYRELRGKAWSELRDAGYPGSGTGTAWTCPWHDQMMGPGYGMMGGRYGMMGPGYGMMHGAYGMNGRSGMRGGYGMMNGAGYGCNW